MISLNDLLSKIDELPPMPAVALRVIELTKDTDVDLKTVASTIEKDPGFTATLLKLCNSSFYGFRSRVGSVQQAASLFGLKKLTQMALTALSSRYLSSATRGYDMDAGELWKHAIVSASISERVSAQCGYRDTGMAYTAGLLHDIGKIIIHDYVGEQFGAIREIAEKDDLAFMDAESRILGFNHAQAGALLLEKWNFPDILVDTIRNHHTPESATIDPRLAEIIQMSDAVTMTMGLGLGADGLRYTISEEVVERLGLSDSTVVNDIIQAMAERIVESPEALLPPRVG